MYKQEQIILTTTGCVDGHRVSEYIELATQIFFDGCLKQRDVSETVNKLSEEATDWLKRLAIRKNADAVLGVQFVSDLAVKEDDKYVYSYRVTLQISGTAVRAREGQGMTSVHDGI